MEPLPYVSTTNACKLCGPLGACLAFRGVEGAVPMLHGSQGCATYMRRYIISHFREPMDIASSALGEKHAVYGGGANLKQGLKNVMTKFGARLIGIATTCLTETIGEDVPMIVEEFRREIRRKGGEEPPAFVSVRTPSYSGTHMEGFHGAVRAVVEQLAGEGHAARMLNLLPGFLSPEDLRHLKEILAAFRCAATILPDISMTLDGPALDDYPKIPGGGTPIEDIWRMGGAGATFELGRTLHGDPQSTGKLLKERFEVALHSMGVPIGLRETDTFFGALEQLTGMERSPRFAMERGRLVDSYVDAHKYLFGKRAVVYGEEDLAVGLTAFLAEVGITPVLCATGGRSGRFRSAVEQVTADILPEAPAVGEGMDFRQIEEQAEILSPDIMIGHSKGYSIARKLGIPLVRVGFPIHDRFGGQRTLHVGYRGTQSLLDRIVNGLIEGNQNNSPVGYGYM
ncbi:nitrogenase component 1 [Syntrophobacter fumaroxidans]|uniref:Nitrogenase n=1 Tax=Syntrophobacter fumaroxidans (strain DSM 10017 / MPOB) TaxID=335543 RepID=A0LH04_SYNFM|nr:nitrogenase component 1 [Syntrophobacter fumaroxidans]ABK16706.1 Nitrogenase [Syntrophobacter fumaroxidans MPOB]